jgi:hypothetical protein
MIAATAAGALAIFLSGFSASALADPPPIGTRFAATGSIEAAFTPGDRIDNLIIAAIASAKHEVLVNAYSFTHRRIAGALVAARKRGVSVQVVADTLHPSSPVAVRLDPDRVEVSGPRQRVFGTDFVVTVHVAIPANDSLPHLVDIDTTRLGLRVRPSQVKVHLVPSAPATASGPVPAKS